MRFLGLLMILAPPTIDASAKDELRFRVDGAAGSFPIVCRLFDSEAGWLKKPIKVVQAQKEDGQLWCSFPSLPRKKYAIAAFEDQDRDGELDSNFIGIPSEPACVSKDAKASFGPPTWKDAHFEYRGGIDRRSCRLID